MSGNRFWVLVSAFVFFASSLLTIPANAAMGGIKETQSPCITKGNSTAQSAILKSAQKQKYCVRLTGQLTLVIGGFTWDEAKANAALLGGKLTGIRNQDEQNILNSFMPSANFNDVWIGGIDRYSNGNWTWDDTSQLFTLGNWDDGSFSTVPGVFSKWDNGEPNNAGTENCVSAVGWKIQFGYSADALWNNLPCNISLSAYLMRTT